MKLSYGWQPFEALNLGGITQKIAIHHEILTYYFLRMTALVDGSKAESALLMCKLDGSSFLCIYFALLTSSAQATEVNLPRLVRRSHLVSSGQRRSLKLGEVLSNWLVLSISRAFVQCSTLLEETSRFCTFAQQIKECGNFLPAQSWTLCLCLKGYLPSL